MDKPIKITRLETENIKRVRAVALAPAVNGVTIIGGDNNQGKTSVLDAIGQIADQKEKYAKEQTFWPDAPKDLISASDLIARQQDILARNGENQRKRAMADMLAQQVDTLQHKVTDLAAQLRQAQELLAAKSADLTTARKTAEQLHDESTEEL